MHCSVSGCVINFSEKKSTAKIAQTIMISMHININDNFSLILILQRCLNPFTILLFSSNALTNNTFRKKKRFFGKLMNDYEFTGYEYAVKRAHLKAIHNVHLCKYLLQPYPCH